MDQNEIFWQLLIQTHNIKFQLNQFSSLGYETYMQRQTDRQTDKVQPLLYMFTSCTLCLYFTVSWIAQLVE